MTLETQNAPTDLCFVVSEQAPQEGRIVAALNDLGMTYQFVDYELIHMVLKDGVNPSLIYFLANESLSEAFEKLSGLRVVFDGPLMVVSCIPLSDGDRVTLFEMGADDIVYPDGQSGEITARSRVVLGRKKPATAAKTSYRFGRLLIDMSSRTLAIDGQKVELTPKEFRVLALLIMAQGEVVPHRTIISNVWGEAYAEDAQYLRVIIVRLREKLEADPAAPCLILTVHGEGYRLSDQSPRGRALAIGRAQREVLTEKLAT